MIKIESNDTKNLVASVACFLLGLLFLYLTWGQQHVDPNHKYAFYIGVLLTSLGGFLSVYRQRYVIRVDPNKKIVIQQSENSIFGTTETVVPFAEVARVSANYIGRYHARSYHLNFVLRNDDKLYTGRWSANRDEMKNLAAEIAQTIGCECD